MTRRRSGNSIPSVTPEEPPSFQPWAAAKMKAMTATERELAKGSVNCIPRGLPAIWLSNTYAIQFVQTPGLLVQLIEVLNNFRVIHTDGRPHPKYPEPLFHGNSSARWEGDTLVIDSIGFDERTFINNSGSWFHSDELRVIERITPSFEELPRRADHGRRSEGADEAVDIRPAPLDTDERGRRRVLLHEQSRHRRVPETHRGRNLKGAR